MNWMLGIILIILGLVVLLGALGVVPVGIWDFFLWIIAVGFGVSGIFALFRSFPKGLVSLTIGIVLVLKLLGAISLGFWAFVGVVAGAWLIQLGIGYVVGWDRYGWRRNRWRY